MLQVFVGFEDLVAVLRMTAATAVPTVKREALERIGFEDAALFHLCFENRVLDEKLRLCDVPVPRNATLRLKTKDGRSVERVDERAAPATAETMWAAPSRAAMIWAARAHKSRRPTTADGAGAADAIRRQPSARARERLERSNRLERPGLLLHPSIRSQAPPWYTPSPAVAAAIDTFDARHQANAASAEFAYQPAAAEPSAQLTRRHTHSLLREGTMKQQLPSSKGGRYS